jgi:hypothetical protein
MFSLYPCFLVPKVADPGCLSWSPDPDFIHPGSRISEPKTEKGEKDVFRSFFVATDIIKLKLILFLNWRRKKNVLDLFTEKNAIKLPKIWFGIWDPGSGKNLSRIPDPGPHIACSMRSLAWLNTIQCTSYAAMPRFKVHSFFKDS